MKRLIFILFLILVSSLSYAQVKFNYGEADKICYRAGEKATFTLNLTSPKDLNVVATTYVYENLNDKIKVASEEKVLKANVAEEIKASWVIPADAKWGYCAEIEVNTGNEKSSAWIYFAVGDVPHEVGHWTHTCNRGFMTKQQVIDNVKLSFKSGHYTSLDYFSWQPSLWETMAPKEDKWISGQTGYLEIKENIKTIVDACHEQGMSVFSYHQGNSWGYAGAEFIRQHPEWWNYDKFGRPFPGINSYDIEIMESTRKLKDPGVHPNWIWWSTGNLINEDMKKMFLNQMKESVEMFGWDGFREDGIAFIADTYDRNGKLIKTDKNEADMANWIRYVRKWMKDNINKDIKLNFNAGSVLYPQEKGSEKVFEAMAEDDSFVLWESALYAYNPGHELNDMRTFAKYAHEEVAAARRAGGRRHIMMAVGINEYLEAITTACGGQADTNAIQDPPQRYAPWAYRSFTFRFSKYFWDNKLEHISDSKKIISVDKNIFWEDLVQKKVEKDGTKYYMIHLINAPENYSASGVVPAPVDNIKVSLKETGKSVKAYVLTPDYGYDSFAKNLDVKEENGFSVTVPEVKQWSVVVFEIK